MSPEIRSQDEVKPTDATRIKVATASVEVGIGRVLMSTAASIASVAGVLASLYLWYKTVPSALNPLFSVAAGVVVGIAVIVSVAFSAYELKRERQNKLLAAVRHHEADLLNEVNITVTQLVNQGDVRG